MTTTTRLALCLLLIASTVLADRQDRSPVVTAAAAGEKVRFSSPGPVAQIRVQILSMTGETLFDSTWKDGNVLDWPAGKLADGSYRYSVMVKDLDGQVAQKESALLARAGQITIEPGAENEMKITLLAHDGANGAVVSTSGDLSFRFGNFLAGKDNERMRLTADGNLGIGTEKPQAKLDVNGLIRASEGIAFSDGTILRSSDGNLVIEKASEKGSGGRIVETVLRSQPPSASPNRLTPRPNAADYQFRVDGAGVHIGTTSAFGLDVAGNVTLASNLALPATSASAGVITLGGSRFLHGSGPNNTFLGPNAGNFGMTGNFNTGIGDAALQSNTTGVWNTGTGGSALQRNDSGNQNTADGVLALFSNVTGSNNTAVGVNALRYNVLGSGNIAVGVNAGTAFNIGNDNIHIGNAGVGGDSGTIRIGTDGTHTAVFLPGTVNVAKVLALPATTSASVGVITIGGNRFAHTFGTNNTFVGTNAGNTTMSGGSNTGNGASALSANTTGSNNAAVGESALVTNTIGNNNVAVGKGALYSTTGSNNIAVGKDAGGTLQGGSNNIDIGNIGCYSGYCTPQESGTIRIGTVGTHTEAFLAGFMAWRPRLTSSRSMSTRKVSSERFNHRRP